MKKIFKLMAVLLIMTFSVTAMGCSDSGKIKEYSETDFLLGTVCTITVYDQAQVSFIKEAFDRIKQIEDIMTIREHSASSEIKALNDVAGQGKWVTLSKDTLTVLKRAINYGDITEGKFDPTVGILTTKWNIGSENARIPTDEEISKGIKLINFKDIEIDEKNSKARLLKKEMVVDLGAIAKGYAGDVAKQLLVEKGVKNAIINLGGNVLLIGENVKGGNWKVGVQDPFRADGKYFAIISGKDVSVVSSGVYERFYEKDGKKYHHILDVKTGYPAETGIVGTTIVSNSSIDGDGFSTSVFLAGVEGGMKLMKDNGVEGVIVTSDKKIYITPGLKPNFDLRDATYKIVN